MLIRVDVRRVGIIGVARKHFNARRQVLITFAECATNLRCRAAERFDMAERYEQEFRGFRMATFYRDCGRDLLGEAQRYERMS